MKGVDNLEYNKTIKKVKQIKLRLENFKNDINEFTNPIMDLTNFNKAVGELIGKNKLLHPGPQLTERQKDDFSIQQAQHVDQSGYQSDLYSSEDAQIAKAIRLSKLEQITHIQSSMGEASITIEDISSLPPEIQKIRPELKNLVSSINSSFSTASDLLLHSEILERVIKTSQGALDKPRLNTLLQEVQEKANNANKFLKSTPRSETSSEIIEDYNDHIEELASDQKWLEDTISRAIGDYSSIDKLEPKFLSKYLLFVILTQKAHCNMFLCLSLPTDMPELVAEKILAAALHEPNEQYMK